MYNVLDNIDLDVGVRIVNSCSYGILKPNIILLGYKNDWFADEDIQTYLNVLKYVHFKYASKKCHRGLITIFLKIVSFVHLLNVNFTCWPKSRCFNKL